MATENTAPQAEAAPAAAVEAPQTQAPVQRDQGLAEAMADMQAALRAESGRKIEADPTDTTAGTAPATETTTETTGQAETATGEGAPDAAQATQEAAQAQEAAAATKEPEKPKEEPTDEAAKALAKYVRGAKANRDEAARLRAESERVKAESTKLAEERSKLDRIAALQAKAEKDPVAAIEELLGGKERISGEMLLQLLERSNGGEAKPATEEERQAAITEAAIAKVKEDLRKEAEEKAKAKEQEEKAAEERGKAVYFGEVDKHLRANADKYPLMAADGWDTNDMAKAVEAHHKATGQWPTSDMVLTHFENLLTQQTEKRYAILAARKQKPAETTAPAAKSPAAAPVKGSAVDAKGKPGKIINNRSVEERQREIEERLERLDNGRA